jgi:hypothetical protein
MRRLLALTLSLLITHTASAELLLYEGFDYAVGDTLSGVPAPNPGKTPPTQALGATNAWNATTAPVAVPANQLITDNNLSYSGFAASTGKSYELPRTNQSNVARITLPGGPYGTTSTDKQIYFSFLMNLTTWVEVSDATASTTASQQGDFIAGFTASSGGGMSGASVYGGQVRIRRELNGSNEQTGKYQLGFVKNNQTAATYGVTWFDNLQWAPASLDVNQTVLVVGEYQLNTSTVTDDTVRLWVNPAPGLSTAPEANLEITAGIDLSTAGTPAGTFNQSNVAAFWFRDGNNVLPGKVTLDELRVGTDWASVTPAGATPVLLGDFNSDGKVDAADYVTWRENDVANSTLPNDDGSTDQAARFSLWRASFGNPAAVGSGIGSSGAAVPEPSAIVLLLTCLAALPRKRR